MSSYTTYETEHKSSFRRENPFKKDRDLIYKHIGLTKKITRYYQYATILFILIITTIHQCTKLYKYLQFKYKRRLSYPLSTPSSKSFWSIQSLKLQSLLLTKPSLPIFSYLFNDYKTLLIITTYYTINAFIFLYNLPMDDSFNLALRSGLVSATNIPLLYLIPLKSGPLLVLINQSYENMIVYHKYIGILVVFMALVHTVAFAYCLTWDYLLNGVKGQTGLICTTAFIFLSIASTGYIRRKFYEIFYYLHLVSFVLFLPVFYRHHYVCKPFVVFVSGCLIYDRVIRWFSQLWIFKCRVLQIDPEDEMMIVSINTNINGLGRIQKLISYLLFKPTSRKFKWKVSNHLFIQIPQIRILESHPFTIANTVENKNPMLIIKIQTGFTKDLFELAQKQDSFTCFIHGPYGNSSEHFPEVTTINQDPFLEIPIPFHIISHESTPLLSSSSKKNKSSTHVSTVSKFSNQSSISSLSSLNIKRQKIILIAGGAGISFTLPLLSIYHNNPFFDVSFIWFVRNEKPLRLIKFSQRDDIIIWCTSKKGRPDIVNMLYDTIHHHANYSRVNIMACGPNSLIDSIKVFSKIEARNGNEVNLITEEFSF